MLKATSARNLHKVLGLSHGVAKALAKVLRETERSDDFDDVEEAMEAVEEAMRQEKGGGIFGVEVVCDPHGKYDWFLGYAAALYVNTGDTYNATVVYDVGRDIFYCTSWSDWLKDFQRRIGRSLP
jgi:hypothetical protein